MSELKCAGRRRYGGAFSMGTPVWVDCSDKPTVMLTIVQDGETQEWPACQTCWQEVVDNGIEILKVVPIRPAAAEGS